MFQQQYRTVPTGLSFEGPKNPTPGKLQGSLQEYTFIASIVFQLVTLIVSAIALAQGGMPSTLMTIVTLELVVQCVEIVWYSTVGGLYLFNGWSISIAYRYLDWLITTPIMMTSILLFVLWDADKQCDNVLGEGSRVAALIIIIVSDVLMLLVGFAYEAKVEPLMNFFNMFVQPCVKACVKPSKENGPPDGMPGWFGSVGLYLGWIPFIGVFTPLFVAVGSAFTTWGLVSALLTFFAWALYGVVAILGSVGFWDEEMRNTAYNVLDIFSKNAVGLIVSSVAIGNDFNTTLPSNCTTY